MKNIIHLENIKLVSVNKKNEIGYNRKTKKSYIYSSTEYKNFKDLICLSCKKIKVEKPYSVIVEFHGYVDIDAFLKPLFDGIEMAGVIENDRYIEDLRVVKFPLKRGQAGKLIVFIGTLKN